MEIFINIYKKEDADNAYYHDKNFRYSIVDILENRREFCKKNFKSKITLTSFIRLLEVYNTLYPREIKKANIVIFDNKNKKLIPLDEYLKKSKFSKEDAFVFSEEYYEYYHNHSMPELLDIYGHSDDFVEDVRNYIKEMPVSSGKRLIDIKSFNTLHHGNITESSAVVDCGEYYITGSYIDTDMLSNKISLKRDDIHVNPNKEIKRVSFTLHINDNDYNDITFSNHLLVEEIALGKESVSRIFGLYTSIEDIVAYYAPFNKINSIEKEKYIKLILLMEEPKIKK